MIRFPPEPALLPLKLEKDEPVVFYDQFVRSVMSEEKVKNLLRLVWDAAYSKGFADRSRLDERLSNKNNEDE